jgi:hypothetical protein
MTHPLLLIRYLFLASLILPLLASAQVQRGSTYYGSSINARAGIDVCMPHRDILAIGERAGGPVNGGQVLIFRWDGNDWVQRGQAMTSVGWDAFGSALDMPDTNTIAVGGPWNDSAALNAGHVKVFHWVNGDWQQKGQDLMGQIEYARFGTAVDMPDPNTLVVGAHEAHPTVDDAGIAVVYRWDGIQWVQKGDTLTNAAHAAWFGYEVSMPDSNTVACSSPYYSSLNAPGYVHVYRWNGTAWVPKGAALEGDAVDDRFGNAIDMLDSNTLVVGADQLSGGSGYVKVYRWLNGAWTQLGNTLFGGNVGARFGYSVSMPDNRHLAVGSRDALVGGNTVGYVRVFKLNGNVWQTVGNDIVGDGVDTWPGFDVHLADSATLAVGSPNFTQTNGEEGQVKVYSICHSNQLSYDTIRASFCNSYISPSGKYEYTRSGIYYDTLIKVNGCDSLFTLDLKKVVIDTSVTAEWPELLAVEEDASYQWYDCDSVWTPLVGDTNQRLTATSFGSYAVVVTMNGCTDTSGCHTFDNVGYTEGNSVEQLRVYPNPLTVQLILERASQAASGELTIRNLAGQIVWTASFGASARLELFFSEPAGIYMLEYRTEAGSSFTRLVKH